MLQLLGVGGAAGITGCASEGDGTATDTDDGGDDGATPGDTPALQQSATIALQSDFTASVWSMYGGLSPYETRVLEPRLAGPASVAEIEGLSPAGTERSTASDGIPGGYRHFAPCQRDHLRVDHWAQNSLVPVRPAEANSMSDI